MSSKELAQHAPAAISLFNNMKTPASILAGAMVGMGFLSPLPSPPPNNSKRNAVLDRMLRKLHILVTIGSFGSELLAVMWATVAVNQLTETHVALAEDVWHILQRDSYDLAWSATNSHFVLGMLGFMWMVGTRVYLMIQAAPWNVDNSASAETERQSHRSMTISAVALVTATLLLMTSIVNRGVASGGGVESESYGASVVSLVRHYIQLLSKQAMGMKALTFGPMEFLSVFLGVLAVVVGGWSVLFEND